MVISRTLVVTRRRLALQHGAMVRGGWRSCFRSLSSHLTVSLWSLLKALDKRGKGSTALQVNCYLKSFLNGAVMHLAL